MLATSLAEFSRYFNSAQGQLWERQSLCKARVVFVLPTATARAVPRSVKRLLHSPGARATPRPSGKCGKSWKQKPRREVLKSGPGGLIDIEFLVQMLQLKAWGQSLPSDRRARHARRRHALVKAGLLSDDDGQFFNAQLPVLCDDSIAVAFDEHHGERNDLPKEPRELAKLAGLLGYSVLDALLADRQRHDYRKSPPL